jgi:hypothetical protein
MGMHLSSSAGSFLRTIFLAFAASGVAGATIAQTEAPAPVYYSWDPIPGIEMRGGLEAYWNVYDWTSTNHLQAYSRGLKRIFLIGPYIDRAGGKKSPIVGAPDHSNAWRKPSHFESTVRGDLHHSKRLFVPEVETLVLDIEHEFQQDVAKAWQDPETQADSGAQDFAEFEAAYFREWSTWFSLPLQWGKEIFPGARLGLYGAQPFRRDYWGIAGKTAQQIDGTHANDALMWQYIDPHVDFYIASIYIFYNNPDAVFYMAANVEENYQRTREYGEKPVYAYGWMRYHNSNRAEGNRELEPWQVEALAMVPYFSGAKGVVLWGYEPQLKGEMGHAYQNLPLYMKSLGRIALLSDKIGQGKIQFDTPAHVLWKEKRPLVRRVDVSEGECVFLAINPWQGENDSSKAEASCGSDTVYLEMKGRKTTLALVQNGVATLFE